MPEIKIGCCGFPEAKGKYYQEFSVVEIQQTFYDLPGLATAEKWRAEAPSGFEFTLKAWQLITHSASSPTYRRLKTPLPQKEKANYGFFQNTDAVFQAWERTREFAQRLGAKMVVFQCPHSFTPAEENIKNLRKFFNTISREGLLFVWEPRGKWDKELIKSLCQELLLLHCVDPFKAAPQYGEIIYFRLHGVTGYRYDYSQQELKNLLQKIQKNRINYIMFNNSEMLANARQFKELLSKARGSKN